MALNVVKCFHVDHRADIRSDQRRVAGHQFFRCALDHFNHTIGDCRVHDQQTQRRAALTGRAESADHHRVDHLLGQRAAVDQHRVDAAGLSDQRNDGAVFHSQCALDDLGDLRGAGEHHTGNAGLGDQRRTHGFARAVQQLQCIGGHTRSMQQIDGELGNAGRLLGGFGQHGVASSESRCHLTRKNRQREIPGADADPDTARGQAQRVGFAGHTVHCANLCAIHHRAINGLHDAFGFICVVTQEVHRFAHFCNCIAPSLERFFDQQRAQLRSGVQHRIGCFAQHGGTLSNICLAPFLIADCACLVSASDVFDIELRHRRKSGSGQRSQQRLAHRRHGQVQPCAVAPRTCVGTKQVNGHRQAALRLQAQRRDQQVFHTDRFVGQLVHER